MSARDEDVRAEELDDEDDVVDDEDDDDDPEAALAEAAGDEEESDEASLEELLSQRAAARRGTDESEDDDDIMALATEKDSVVDEPLPVKVVPIKDQKEFVCSHCHLVKARVQLADEKRMLCRDCV